MGEPRQEPEVDLLYSYRVGGRRGARRDFHLLYQAARQLARTHQPEQVTAAFRHDLKVSHALTGDRFLCLSGCSLAWKGQGLLVLGASGSGLSRLAQALVGEGAELLEEQLALVRREDGALQSLQGEAYPIGLVLLTRYRAGAAFRPRRLAPNQAFAKIFRLAPTAPFRPHPVLRDLGRLIPGWRVLQGSRCEAEAVAPALLSRM